MKKIFEHRVAILISFIVGVLLIYLEPLVTGLGEGLVDIAIYSSRFFSDWYYSEVALNDPNLFTSFSNYILTFFFIIFNVGALIFLRSKHNDLRSRVNDNLTKILQSRENLVQENNDPISKDEVMRELDELEVKARLLTDKIPEKDRRLVIIGILVGLLSVILIISYGVKVSIGSTNLSFKNKLTIIKPYISESEYDELNSDWARMENSEDFNDINERVIEFTKRLKE